MLANQNLMIQVMEMNHGNIGSVLALVSKACGKLGLEDVGAECEQTREALKDMESMFATLRDASTGDLSKVLEDVKKYASDVVAKEAREMEASLKKSSEATASDIGDRFKKLESRVLSELATGAPSEDPGGGGRPAGKGDAQLLKKVAGRMSDFEAQVSSQLQVMSADIEKKIAFIGAQQQGKDGAGGGVSSESLAFDLDQVKYDLGELKDIVGSTKNDTASVKRIVLANERDMEDFTAAMDAVNVDLDEMRARVDSTHSIITSRQRVEATVTAEISTMRLDMGDMQEALKAHDAWMEDVSQSLQEAHERCHQLSEDIAEVREQTQAKLDQKTDIVSWNDMNDDVDASIKTVRDMASTLRLEVDSRRRKVDEMLNQMRGETKQLEEKVDANTESIHRTMQDNHSHAQQRIDERFEHCRSLEDVTNKHADVHQEIQSELGRQMADMATQLSKVEADLKRTHEDNHKEINDRADGMERNSANLAKENAKRLNALDLRISGLQGASGEQKRDINKLRDETNSLTVKSAAHDVDVGKNSDDIRKIERQRAEDNQRFKQDMDAVYEELDQKVYEKNFQSLEDNVTKLTRGTVKLCQVIGVFPGARMNDGTQEELDVDVELLNWEDCAQNLTGRVEKTWRQASSQKYRSVLDLVSKKADHSVLRLLQISQQHIESQLDRVRHERELWKEVVDKRTQQPLQLALALKDPHTGQPLSQPAGYGNPGVAGAGDGPTFTPPMSDVQPDSARGMMPAALLGPPGMVAVPDHPSCALVPGGAMKASPLAKRITRPQQGVAPAKA